MQEPEADHEDISNQILTLLLLLAIQNWLCGILRRRASRAAQRAEIWKQQNRQAQPSSPMLILNDQAISLLLGLTVSLVVLIHPGGFMKEYADAIL